MVDKYVCEEGDMDPGCVYGKRKKKYKKVTTDEIFGEEW